MVFSADAILDQEVTGEADIETHYDRLARQFLSARSAAINNTRYYLSMVNELDVYVATSMRTREDFRNMAETCDEIFGAPKLAPFDLRYFDPTLSAADGHEDNGFIECLMVKSAKVLVYIAGQKESFGKDAEAAMALSLGKPVIFLCDEESKKISFAMSTPWHGLLTSRRASRSVQWSPRPRATSSSCCREYLRTEWSTRSISRNRDTFD